MFRVYYAHLESIELPPIVRQFVKESNLHDAFDWEIDFSAEPSIWESRCKGFDLSTPTRQPIWFTLQHYEVESVSMRGSEGEVSIWTSGLGDLMADEWDITSTQHLKHTLAFRNELELSIVCRAFAYEITERNDDVVIDVIDP